LFFFKVNWEPLQQIMPILDAELWPLGSRAEGSATEALGLQRVGENAGGVDDGVRVGRKKTLFL